MGRASVRPVVYTDSDKWRVCIEFIEHPEEE
jgi:hypothetical protein